jgi:flagellar basal-body rod protein FlgB
LIKDISIAALTAAARGLEVRQQAIAANVANVETPGYRARRVEFETALRSAIAAGTPLGAAPVSVSRSDAPTRENGNNVNVDFELVQSSETLLRQQLVSNALTSRFNVMRTAVGR